MKALLEGFLFGAMCGAVVVLFCWSVFALVEVLVR